MLGLLWSDPGGKTRSRSTSLLARAVGYARGPGSFSGLKSFQTDITVAAHTLIANTYNVLCLE